MAWSARYAQGATGHLLRLSTACKNLKEGYDVVVASDQEQGPCMLKCKDCGEVMSPNNPLQTCKQHNLCASALARKRWQFIWMTRLCPPDKHQAQ
eukprot:1159344-Pelagomonas_calceolata.AAC.11